MLEPTGVRKPTPPEPQRAPGELPQEKPESASPTPAVPISVRNATTGGTSGIATPNLPNPNRPVTGDKLDPQTLRDMRKKAGG
jgi:hypothetical protein